MAWGWAASAVCVVAMSAWANVAVGADAPLVGPPPPWVQPPPAPVPIAAAPDANPPAVHNLLLDQQVRIEPGSTSIYSEDRVRAQTAEGLTALGALVLPWDPATQTLTVNKVAILRDGKAIDALAGQKFTVLRRETQLESAVLDGTLTATLQVEGLRLGDVLDVAVTYLTADPILGGHINLGLTAAPATPEDDYRLRVTWSRDVPLRWRFGDATPAPKVTAQATGSELTLEMRNVQPLAPPQGAPSRFSHGRDIELTSFGSWAEVAAIFAPLYAKASSLPPGSPLKAEAEKIRAASADPATRAAMALQLVQEQVRYFALGMGQGGYTPADADTTWTRRFGDCKAKAALLLALLRALGIEAQPALVSTSNGDGLDARLPSVAAFDHVIVRAVIAGKSWWLDGTRTGDLSLPLLETPPYRWALPVQAVGARLVPLPVAPRETPDTSLSLRLDASAGLSLPAPAHGEFVFRGDSAISLAREFADLIADQREQAMRQVWAKQYSFLDIKSVNEKFDAGQAEFALTVDGTAAMDWDSEAAGTERYEADGVGVGWKADPPRPPGPHADAPFATDFPEYSISTESIVLPYGGAGFSIDGAEVKRTLEGHLISRTAVIDHGVFTVTAIQKALAPEVPFAVAQAEAKTLSDLAGTSVFVVAPKGYAKTAAEWRAETKTQPKTASDYIDRGLAFERLGQGGKALADYDAAVALDGRSALALADRGGIELGLGLVDKARADDGRALALDPRQGVAQALAGRLAFREGRFGDAANAFASALTEYPNNVVYWRWKSEADWQQEEYAAAASDVQSAIDLTPGAADLRLLLANCLRLQGQPQKGLAELDAAVKADPNDADLLLRRAWFLHSLGETAQARRDVDEAITLRPMAAAYLAREEWRDSSDEEGKLADVEAALKLAPNSGDVLAIWARVQLDAGRASAAADALRASAEARPTDPYPMIVLGWLDAKRAMMSAAEADFAAARARAAKNAWALNSLCWDEAVSEPLLAAALADCQASLALDPLSPATLDSRALVELKQDHLDAAIADYGRALQLSPHQTDSLYARGIAKRRKGLTRDGDDDIAAASKLDPDVSGRLADVGLRP